MLKLTGLFGVAVCLMATGPSDGSAAVPAVPVEAKTLPEIVLDIKAPLNNKLDELRRTYGIREIAAGEFQFTDKDGDVVLSVETGRTLNADGTQKVETFLYRNGRKQLILQETVITRGRNLWFHDFEKRLFQTGIERYDLEGPGQTRKEATLSTEAGTIFKVLSVREKTGTGEIKLHRVSVGDSQLFDIRDTIHEADSYRTYEYIVHGTKAVIMGLGSWTSIWHTWKGTLRIGIRLIPGLLLPEITYEKTSTSGYARIGSFQGFSRELHKNFVSPLIDRGPVQAIRQETGGHAWPASRSMQSIGTESKFLNELIVIRNDVNRAKANPAVLSLIDVKLNVIIKDIQEGKLKVNDFR